MKSKIKSSNMFLTASNCKIEISGYVTVIQGPAGGGKEGEALYVTIRRLIYSPAFRYNKIIAKKLHGMLKAQN